MTMPNPTVPEGSQLEQKSRARSRVKLAVFFVLSIHVVGLMALLVQGCRPEEQDVPEEILPPTMPTFEPVTLPYVDTNQDPVLQRPVTNLPPTYGQPTPETSPVMEPGYGAPTAVSAPEPMPTVPVMSEPEPRTYKIQKGDTYYSIGRQFGVSMNAIQQANPGVDPTRLQLGQVINIPAPAAPTAAPAPVLGSGQTVHKVVSGDTLSSIAQRYGTTWQEIQKLNNLPTTNIKVGQELRIPASGAGSANGF